MATYRVDHAVIVALVKTLTDWLSSDALKFELLFLSKATELELRTSGLCLN